MNSDNHAELTSALGPWTRWCLLTLGYMFMLFNGSTAALAADAGSVPANCPAGYANMGAYCSRAADKYSNPSAVKCREGYTKNGLFCDRPAHTLGLSALTCPAGYLQHATNKSRCMPQTGGSVSANAPSNAAVLAADAGSVPANCPAGYANMGAYCSRAADKYSNPSAVKCREGYTKNGLFCDRPAHTLGLSALTCPAGYLQHATNKSKCMPQTGGSPSGNLNK